MKENADTIDVDAVPIGSEAAEILKGGGALVRLENQTQMMIALQHPRNEALILKSAVDELVVYEEAAEEAIYSKPVGKEKVGDEWVMKYAEGLSIRAAEALALRWGNNAFGAEIITDDGETVSGVATWLDYESNNRRTFPFRISRKYKSRGGTMARHPEDRFNDIVVPAKLSRVLREVILRSLPAGLKKAYERKAREIMATKGANKVPGVIKAFALHGVGQKDLEALIGKPMTGWDGEDVTKLVGIGNAIKAGETTVSQAFGHEEPEKETPTVGSVFNGAPKGFEEGKKGETEPPPAADPPPVGKSDGEMREDLWSMLLALSKNDANPQGNPDVADKLLAHYGKVEDLKALAGENLIKVSAKVREAIESRKITGA